MDPLLILDQLQTLREEHPRRTHGPLFAPQRLTAEFQRAKTNETFDAFLAHLIELTRLEPRTNANPASMFSQHVQLLGWNSAMAARVWSRAQHGPDALRERRLAQSIDAFWRAHVRRTTRQ
jgi:hypothetical protein